MTPSRTLNPTLRGLAILVLAALLAALVACSDGAGPSVVDLDRDPALAGAYVAGGDDAAFGAIVFEADTAAISRDVISEGGSIRLELNSDGSTAGRLFVPDVNVPDGSNDFEADLVGTWASSDGILTLSQPADTFLRDMEFTVEPDRLVGDQKFGGVRIRVELVRQGS